MMMANLGRSGRVWGLIFLVGGASLSGVAAADTVLFTGEGEHYDLGMELEGRAARLYLADKFTNEPLGGKVVEFVPHEDGEDIKFKGSSDPGVYLAIFPDDDMPSGQIIVNYEEEDEDTIDLQEPGHEGHDHGAHGHHEDGVHDDHGGHAGGGAAGHDQADAAAAGWDFDDRRTWLAILSGAGLFLIGWTLGRARGRRAVAGGLLLACGLGLAGTENRALAGPGHSHAEVGIANPGEGTTIRVTKKSQFLIGLTCVEATHAKVPGVFRTFGHVVAKPQLDAVIRAPRDGVLRGIEENIWGKSVKRGDVLARIDSVGLVPMTSPISGTVIQAVGVSGARVSAGDEIMRVVDTSRLWVDAEVFQKDLQHVQGASDVFVMLDIGKEGIQKTARLVGAQTVVDEHTLMGKIFLEVNNADGAFSMGNTVQVHFQLGGETTEGMLLPRQAVLHRGAEIIVYLKTGPETFEPRPVAYGPGPEPGTVVVTKGLNSGDRVVVNGNYQLLVGAK